MFRWSATASDKARAPLGSIGKRLTRVRIGATSHTFDWQPPSTTTITSQSDGSTSATVTTTSSSSPVTCFEDITPLQRRCILVPHLFEQFFTQQVAGGGGGKYQPNTPAARVVLNHLQWLLQKDILGQDIFLLGPPGPYRRRLVSYYCQLTSRELEYLVLSQDSSESDLKERRDICDGSVIYTPQAPLRAAVQGRMLLLDGVERAERNVLPSLNNLLENRQMNLSSGRRLIRGGPGVIPAKTDLVTNPNFRVVALGLPVPQFPGFPLDPPFRSRFQCRVVGDHDPAGQQAALEQLLAENSSSSSSAATMSTPVMEAVSRVLQVLKEVEERLDAGLAFPRHLCDIRERLQYAVMASPPLTAAPKQDHQTEKDISSSGGLDGSSTTSSLEVPPLQPLPEALRRLGAVHPLFQRWALRLPAAGKVLEGVVEGLQRSEESDGGEQRPSDPLLPFVRETAVNHVAFLQDMYPKDLSVAEVTNAIVESLSGFSSSSSASGGATTSTGGGGSRAVCVLGPRCSGKSLAAKCAAATLMANERSSVGGETNKASHLDSTAATMLHDVQVLHCYSEMSCADLFERRILTASHDTAWVSSPLVVAALRGDTVVLDGIHRCTPGTLAVLSSLLHDGEASLPSGKRLLAAERFDALCNSLQSLLDHDSTATTSKSSSAAEDFVEVDQKQMVTVDGVVVLRASPSFRVIALAEPPTSESMWMSTEVLSLFRSFIALETFPLAQLLPSPSDRTSPEGEMDRALKSLVSFRDVSGGDVSSKKESAGGATSSGLDLNPRQLHRVVRAVTSNHVRTPAQLEHLLHRLLMVPFMPRSHRSEMGDRLKQLIFINDKTTTTSSQETKKAESEVRDLTLQHLDNHGLMIGNVKYTPPRRHKPDPALVPRVGVFYPISSQLAVMQDMLNELAEGERNFLLIGNQGTGKNKVTDCMLEWLGLEREYIQLHRDSTVQSLTMTPSVSSGVMKWELSPLLLAAIHGHVAVVDEADKAPVEVVCVLKAILNDRHLSLPDGRVLRCRSLLQEGDDDLTVATRNGVDKAVEDEEDARHLWIHPDFKCFVLANRPGFPFLGNDFFRDCGDALSCHILHNPDVASELHLLKNYAPDVSPGVLRNLVNAFASLRQKTEDGELSYPFSARELVGIARHLQKFPSDSVASAVDNVFAFDSYNALVNSTVSDELERAGVVLDAKGESIGSTIDVSFTTAAGGGGDGVSSSTTTSDDDDVLRSRLQSLRELIRKNEKKSSEGGDSTTSAFWKGPLAHRNKSYEVASDLRTVQLGDWYDARSSGHFSELVHTARITSFSAYFSPSKKIIAALDCTSPSSSEGDSSSERRVALVCRAPNAVLLLPPSVLRGSSDAKNNSSGGETSSGSLDSRDSIRELEVTFTDGPITAAMTTSVTPPVLMMTSADEVGSNVSSCTTTTWLVLLSVNNETLWFLEPYSRVLHSVTLPRPFYVGSGSGSGSSSGGAGGGGGGEVFFPRMGRSFMDAERHILHCFSSTATSTSSVGAPSSSSSVLVMLNRKAGTLLCVNLATLDATVFHFTNAASAAESDQGGNQNPDVVERSTLSEEFYNVDTKSNEYRYDASVSVLAASSPFPPQSSSSSTTATGEVKVLISVVGKGSWVATVPIPTGGGDALPIATTSTMTVCRSATLDAITRYNAGLPLTTPQTDGVESKQQQQVDPSVVEEVQTLAAAGGGSKEKKGAASFVSRMQLLAAENKRKAAAKRSVLTSSSTTENAHSPLVYSADAVTLYTSSSSGQQGSSSPTTTSTKVEAIGGKALLQISPECTSTPTTTSDDGGDLLPEVGNNQAIYLAPLQAPLRALATSRQGRVIALTSGIALSSSGSPTEGSADGTASADKKKVTAGGGYVPNPNLPPKPFPQQLSFVDTHHQMLMSITRDGCDIATGCFLDYPNSSSTAVANSQSQQLADPAAAALPQRFLAVTVRGDLELWEFGTDALMQSRATWHAQLGGTSSGADGAAGEEGGAAAGVEVQHVDDEAELNRLLEEQQQELAAAMASDTAAQAATNSSDAGSGSGGDQQQEGTVDGGEGGGGDSGDGQGQGRGSGSGGGQGGGPSGGPAGRIGNPMGGSGADKQSDGTGGYSFLADGTAVVKTTPSERRRISNAVRKQEPSGNVNYDKYLNAVTPSIVHVVQVLEAAEAKDKQRAWAGFQTQGELDDRRLVDAVIGDSNVFKRRRVPPTQLGVPLKLPKRIEFCVDVSASMARYNGWDGRLDRLAEAIVLAMEALNQFPHKFRMSVVGHSGSTDRLPLLLAEENAMSTLSKRAAVIDKIVSHSRMAATGDGTIECLRQSLDLLSQEEADERFVIVISDANLGGYDVSVKEVLDIINPYRPLDSSSASASSADSSSKSSNRFVNSHIIFLAEPQAAKYFTKELPPGVAHNCPNTKDLPLILREIILGMQQ